MVLRGFVLAVSARDPLVVLVPFSLFVLAFHGVSLVVPLVFLLPAALAVRTAFGCGFRFLESPCLGA